MMTALKRLLFFGIGLLVTFSFFEIYLQSSEIQTPMETRIDPEIGPSYIANKKVTRFNEGFYIGGINKNGYYGPSYPKQKAEAEKRVLMLGDSYVMGITLFERYHFGRLLEHKMNKAMEDSIQVLNFGRADFNFWNMYQYYRDFAGTWDHDLVLFFVGGPDLIPVGQMEKDLYPFVYDNEGQLAINYGFRNSEKFHNYQMMAPVIANSALFRLTFNTKKMIRRGELSNQMLDKFAPLFFKNAAPSNHRAGGNAKGTTLPKISRMILDDLSKDPRVVLVVKRDISPALMSELHGYSMPIIELTTALKELEDSGIDPYFWPVTGKRGHWNHAAHSKIASFLNPKVQQILRKESYSSN